MAIRETSDAGLPIVATQPDGPHAKAYRAIAQNVRVQLDTGGAAEPAPRIAGPKFVTPRDQLGAGGARQAPKIVIEA